MNDYYNKSNWTIDSVIRSRAVTYCKKPLCEFEGETITYQDALLDGSRVANFLNDLGVGPNDYVGVMLDNTAQFCQCWFGLSIHGSVLVAINTAYKGAFLSHVLNNSKARILFVESEYADHILQIADDLQYLHTIVVQGLAHGISSRFQVRQFSEFEDFKSSYAKASITYRDTACVMYTSGTTGPSKGVVMPHAHIYLFGLGTITHMGLNENDRFYIVLPLFHANGLFMQLYATMIAGATAFIRKRFSASSWLHDLKKHNLTITNSLGTVAAYVLNQPASKLDKDHQLRIMSLAPTSEAMELSLKERFGIKSVVGLYGMTEINIPLYAVDGISPPGSCGRVWDEFYEVRVVDELTDEIVAENEIGEFVIRPRQPYAFMSGYVNMPDKTIEAWRNFWFHTGDAVRIDAGGNVFFVDRIKDCIRRKGENISSFEIESALLGFHGVEEIAAYAVPADLEGTEDEVMVAIVPVDNTLNLNDLYEYSIDVLPVFAVPRFYRLIPELPKTPTGKVQKMVLKKEGTMLADLNVG